MEFEPTKVAMTIFGAMIAMILVCSFAIPVLLSIEDSGEQSGDSYSYTPTWPRGFEPVTVTTESLPSFLSWDGTKVSGTLEAGQYKYTLIGTDENEETHRITQSINVSDNHAGIVRMLFIFPTFLGIGILFYVLRRSGISINIGVNRR